MATEAVTYPTVDVTTEYGYRRPDGVEVWDRTVRVKNDPRYNDYTDITTKELHESKRRRGQFADALRVAAESVGIPAEEYIDQHQLITRQRIVTVLPTVYIAEPINLPF
ncbi:hypothetical protein SEA_MUFASA8_61 [Arthrobacter phage Mufasa8]|uniref:Uncharacterized protein n=1 Tax=Arthrobacter phage Mufasa8 TaxID=2656526 RepID=A0A649VNA1_9CAUD|nr:hypothetical protein HYQ08_gp061 [Arthrobacter phage Mufasa8]QGJ93509.1 hypothetical protein SEA_MUFASA8_61 [Arthrobacter phage Mufasa8]